MKKFLSFSILFAISFSHMTMAQDGKEKSATVKNPVASYEKHGESDHYNNTKATDESLKTSDASGLLFNFSGSNLSAMDLKSQNVKLNYKK